MAGNIEPTSSKKQEPENIRPTAGKSGSSKSGSRGLSTTAQLMVVFASGKLNSEMDSANLSSLISDISIIDTIETRREAVIQQHIASINNLLAEELGVIDVTASTRDRIQEDLLAITRKVEARVNPMQPPAKFGIWQDQADKLNPLISQLEERHKALEKKQNEIIKRLNRINYKEKPEEYHHFIQEFSPITAEIKMLLAHTKQQLKDARKLHDPISKNAGTSAEAQAAISNITLNQP